MRIDPPDAAAAEQARSRQATLTKPAGALGRLEELSIWLAAVQGRCPPRPPQHPRVVVVAGDHGVAACGVSAYPREVTAQMVANFLAGGAAVNVLADTLGATVRVLDVAVDGDVPMPPGRVPTDLTRWKVRRGSGRLDVEDALSAREARAAVQAGADIADDEIDAGADLLIPGDMGIGNTTAAAVVVGALTGAGAHAVTGRGTGIDDAALQRKRAIVAAGLARARKAASNPIGLLAAVGGADIGALAGLLARAAQRRTPVLLDGVVSGAAALVAEAIAPGARAWWAAGHRSTEPAHALALTRLGLEPLLDLGLRLGEGSGALLALPLLRAAADTLTRMATFEQAGVSDRD